MSRRSEQASLFNAFHAHGVEYVIVGGIAVNAHGVQRNTRDLDIFIRPTVENAAATHKAFRSLGAPVDDIDATDFLNDDNQFTLHLPYGTIDILPSIGEMPFDQAWRNRIETDFDGVSIWFISREDLIANKLQVGRHQDLSDAEKLQRLSALQEVHFPEE